MSDLAKLIEELIEENERQLEEIRRLSLSLLQFMEQEEIEKIKGDGQ